MGQGAFYAERHEGFNIVYDCGELYNGKQAKEVVKQAFNGDIIDILFISHLDYDHISMIETLKATNTIKNVILPLTQPEGRIISKASCIRGEKTIKTSVISLIDNPREYFDKETKVIEIKPFDEGSSSLNMTADPISIENCGEKIPSGTVITVSANYSCHGNSNSDNWCFIPFNFESSSRISLFKKEITTKELDYDKLSDLEYFRNHLKKIKECYERTPGGTNGNSLVLYSGPSKEGWILRHHYYYGKQLFWGPWPYGIERHLRDKVACVYTGDVNLHDVNLNSIFPSPYADFIGTVQVPHHGSQLSFDSQNFINKHTIAPISFGNNNNFGHPSTRVIHLLLKCSSIPVPVTNDMSSIYIQVIFNRQRWNL